jgi:hypothetical protein
VIDAARSAWADEAYRTGRATDGDDQPHARDATAAVQAEVSHAEDVRSVLAAEDRRYQAMQDADLTTLDELFADELSYAHSSGARDTKSQYVEKVRSGYYVYRRIDHPVERVEVVGDTAIVVGRMTADLEVQGTPKTIDNLALAVWTRASGDWRLLAYAPTSLPA